MQQDGPDLRGHKRDVGEIARMEKFICIVTRALEGSREDMWVLQQALEKSNAGKKH
jgi:hypothetical protein